MSRVGEKYIIEIDREYKAGESTLYGVKGFNSLVMDDFALEKFEKYKEKKEILDQEEKDYLRAVIKPFRKRVLYIKRERFLEDYIEIGVKPFINSIEMEEVRLPYFGKNKMYKNMVLKKEYTCEELGL